MVIIDEATGVVTITDDTPTVHVVREGAPGPSLPSADTGNHITVGSDGLLHSSESHADMVGLDEDDHPQYMNQLRGDARYSLYDHAHDDAAKVTVSATKPVSPVVGEMWVPEG